MWYKVVEDFLLQHGWTRLDTDWSVFRDRNRKCVLLLYVDNILLFAWKQEALATTVSLISQKFTVREENLKQYLGINIDINREKGYTQLSMSKHGGEVQRK